ncbi:MAG: hypothetical protein LKI99_00825 [Acetobacter fabarum]|jgi:hypothetical protein|nr:hypothetical protein [Acetobacter sp. DsW_54]MCI1242408.1 hypothetical protein [Acetobacter fabarum]MCI1908244.1 hypothetical protein [Acetobacter fabarum]MCI1927045.1 hypothetical protein [Acetobacter fabarum]MCI1947045.1 hypothetical protein [Acetobacter fabarum]MCI1987733.1 hypothetical protein [Acetobacter fabarum]
MSVSRFSFTLPTAVLLSAISLLAVAVPLRPALAGEFTVTDEKADMEISEVSRIYLDGKLVSEFRLDDATRYKTVRIPTPLGRVDHTYTLCGEITIRTADGRAETHEVSSSGLLHNPDGHHFDALGSDGFKDFFLVDPQAPQAAERLPGRGEVCSAPIS